MLILSRTHSPDQMSGVMLLRKVIVHNAHCATAQLAAEQPMSAGHEPTGYLANYELVRLLIWQRSTRAARSFMAPNDIHQKFNY